MLFIFGISVYLLISTPRTTVDSNFKVVCTQKTVAINATMFLHIRTRYEIAINVSMFAIEISHVIIVISDAIILILQYDVAVFSVVLTSTALMHFRS